MKRKQAREIAAVHRWTCPACKHTLATTYCPACGECRLRAEDLTLRGLWHQIVQACISLDGPILRSFRCLMTRPGALTTAYMEGLRKPYTLPLPLFLVTNVLFFAMQSLTGVKIFSTPLDQHLHSDIWGGVAQQLVAHHLETQRTTMDLYTPVFNQAVAVNAKSLVVLMVLPFALLPAMMFYGSRRPFVAHVVFSLHFYAFLLLLLCVSLGVVAVQQMSGGRGLESESFDHTLSIVELVACAIYLYVAAGTVYGAKGAARVLKILPLAIAVGGIFLGYRFALLLITLYNT